MQSLLEAWIIRLVHISIAALFIGAVAGLAISLLRVRDANLRHRIWTAVLLGMMAMPILASITPGIPMPNWAALPISRAVAVADPEIGELHSPFVGKRLNSQTERQSDARLVAANLGQTANSSNGMLIASRAQSTLPELMPDPQRTPPHGAVAQNAAAQSRIQPVSRWLAVVAIAYLLVAISLLGDLVVGLILLRRIVRHASEIRLELPASLGLPRFGRRMPRIVQSDRVQVPGTVGFIRPVVLLPMEWRNWSELKLLAVLAHELAHVRRADWLLTTLAEINRALYWFHPVAWLVRRRLADLAEQNCDDAALEADGSRTRYATYLLEVAAAMSSASPGRQSRYSVAMARRSIVAERIDAVLDIRRPLARRLGAARVIGLLAICVPAILVAAALRPVAADTNPAAKSKSMPMATNNSKPATAQDPGMMASKEATRDAAAAKTLAHRRIAKEHVKGRVLSPGGKPFAGAAIYAVWSGVRADPQSEKHEDMLIAETQSDTRGDFDLSFASAYTPTNNGWYVVAAAPGFGPAWFTNNLSLSTELATKVKSTITLQLTPDQPIHGRIVDLQGVPLAGVRVGIDSVIPARSKQAMLDWIQEAKTKRSPHNDEEYTDFSLSGQPSKSSPFAGKFPANENDANLCHHSPAIPADTVTDTDGRFQLSGLGADRLAILVIESPAIARSFVHVLTRQMTPIAAEPYEFYGYRSWKHYGCDFEFAAEPTQPIVGTASDADSGHPLAGIKVSIQQFAGTFSIQQDFLTARTDALGRYKLIGAPCGGGHEVGVDFSTDQPYFPTEKKIRKSSGFEPIECDFALHRGQWIVGKVTDRESGSPIVNAAVEYLPLRTNKFAPDYPNYDPIYTGYGPRERYKTSVDGTFRVLAIPGPGILAAIDASHHSRDGEHRYVSLTLNSVPKRLLGRNGYLKTYLPWTVTGYNALREIDLAKSDKPTAFDLQLTRGSARIVKLVDAGGKSVVGARVLGRVFPPGLDEPADKSTIEVAELQPNDPRDFVAIQPERRIGIATKVGPGGPLTLELLPCAIARGRIVGPDGGPVAGLRVNVSFARPDNWDRELISATTGPDGRFEALLPPGTDCELSVYLPPTFNLHATCRPRPGVVFELGDLGDGTKLGIAKTEKMIVKPKGDHAGNAVH